MATNRDGIYVSKLGFGEKYYFASISIPNAWFGAGEVIQPADLAETLGKWRAAWLREKCAHAFGSNDGQPVDDHCSKCGVPWAKRHLEPCGV